VTERFEPQAATAARVDLGSFPQPGVAVVFGAGGGIGAALVESIRAAEKFEHVVAFSRSTSPSIDLLDEASLERAAVFAADLGELRLVIAATGFLHDDRQGPEKSWRQLDAVNLARSFALNATGPALIMKHVLPRLPRSGKAVFALGCRPLTWRSGNDGHDGRRHDVGHGAGLAFGGHHPSARGRRADQISFLRRPAGPAMNVTSRFS
jgi:NAD(P)-dependent dehydrogenase (short-subunit alcohol dehydrogenase family)